TSPPIGSGNFIVEISTDQGENFVSLEVIHNNAIEGWQKKVINLSDYNGEIVKIRINANRIEGSYYIGFDNFVIEPIPEFDVPVDLLVTNIGVNSARFNWELPLSGSAVSYEYYYSTDT